MIKVDKEREIKWKVEEAIDAFTRYKKAIEEEKVKAEMIKELKKKSKEFKELANELE